MPEAEGLSRRALFGAGIGRAMQARFDRTVEAGGARPRREPSSQPPFSGWGEGDSAGLGRRLGPVADDLLASAAVGRGTRVLICCAGDGVLARAASRLGADVVAVDASPARVARGRELDDGEGLDVTWLAGSPASLPLPPEDFGAVLSLFGASHAEDPRAVAGEMVRVARPGAVIALSAWTGLMGDVLHVAGGPARRSPRWARFETAYLHFFDFPELDVRTGVVPWRFGALEDAVDELAAPAAATGAELRLREALPALLERHADPSPGDGLHVRSAYAVASARRPTWL